VRYVKPGSKLRVGVVEVVRDKGLLTIKDPYSRLEYLVSDDLEVSLLPVPPIHVPLKLSKYLYIKIRNPVIVGKDLDLWVKVPYELAVVVNKELVGVVTPFKVKHILHGNVVDGLVCRYYESKAYSGEPGDVGIEALAKVRVVTNGKPVVLKYVIVPAENLIFYEVRGRYYYEVLRSRRTPVGFFADLTRLPPVEEGVEVARPNPLSSMHVFRGYLTTVRWASWAP